MHLEDVTTYYDFGRGKVPAHRHKNVSCLGGWVANTAFVQDTAYIGPNAEVFDHAQIYDKCIVNCDLVHFSSLKYTIKP